jgi:hypothetical protein
MHFKIHPKLVRDSLLQAADLADEIIAKERQRIITQVRRSEPTANICEKGF